MIRSWVSFSRRPDPFNVIALIALVALGAGLFVALIPYQRERMSRRFLTEMGVNDSNIGVQSDCPKWLTSRVPEQWLAPFDRVTYADLREIELDDDGLARLSGLTQLENLHLPDTTVTDAGLVYLAGMSKLIQLDLRRTRVTGTGFASLRGRVPVSGLELSRTKITEEGMIEIGQWTTVGYLDLSDTDITDDSLVHIRKLRLQEIDLSGTSVTHAGLSQLNESGLLTRLGLARTRAGRGGAVGSTSSCERRLAGRSAPAAAGHFLAEGFGVVSVFRG